MPQKLSSFLPRPLDFLLDPPISAKKTSEAPKSIAPQFIYSSKVLSPKETQGPISTQRFASEPSSKNQTRPPSSSGFTAKHTTPTHEASQVEATPQVWITLLEFHFTEIDALPLAPAHRARIREQLQDAFAAKHPARIRHALEELQTWKQYGALKIEQAFFYNFLSEVYPEQQRKAPPTPEAIANSPFLLTWQQLSDEDKKTLDKILQDPPQDLDPKQLSTTLERETRLYSKTFLKNFFDLYQKNWKQFFPKNHSLPLTEIILATLLEQESLLSEIKHGTDSLQWTYFTENYPLEEALENCLVRLAAQEPALEALENDLALELSQLEENIRDSFSKQRDDWEREWLGTERSGEDWNDFETWVESQVQNNPKVLAAKQKLQSLTSDRKTLNHLINAKQTSPHELLESLYEVVEGLEEIEREWLQKQWQEELTFLQDLNHQEYDDLLVAAEENLDKLNYGAPSREQWHKFSVEMQLLETFYTLKDLAPGNYFVLSLQERLSTFQKQEEPSADQVEDLKFRLEVHHSYAVARYLNPQHRKTLALREALLGLEEWEHPPLDLLAETQSISQEALLTALLTSRIQHWTQLELSNLQIDALKDGLGLWGREAERYQEVRKISGEYSHALSLLETGHFSQARALYLRLEQDSSIAQWQAKTQIESFLGPLILEAIGVSGAALTGEIFSHSVLSTLNTRRIHPTIRGLNLLFATKRVFQDGRLMRQSVEKSRTLTRLFYASNTLGFTLGHRYFQHGFQDKSYWDQHIAWQDNELGKSFAVNALMFSFLRNTMKLHQSLQVKKLLPTAAKNLEDRLGTQAFRQLNHDEFVTGLRAELELLSHSLRYKLGAFSWELSAFTAFEPIALNIEKNWHRATQGQALQWESPGDFLWNPQSWGHRISFLLALKCSATITHPFPKHLPDPAMEIREHRLMIREKKLEELLAAESPELDDLHTALLQVYEARIELLETLDRPSHAQRGHLNWVRQQKQELETQWRQELGLKELANVLSPVGPEHWSYEDSQKGSILKIVKEYFAPEQVEIKDGVLRIEIYDPTSEKYESLFLFPQVSDPHSIAANTSNLGQPLRQVVNGNSSSDLTEPTQLLIPLDHPNDGSTPTQASSTNHDGIKPTASGVREDSRGTVSFTPNPSLTHRTTPPVASIPRLDRQGKEIELLREYYKNGNKESLAVAADLLNSKADPRGELIHLKLKLEELKRQDPNSRHIEITQRIEQIENALKAQVLSILGDSAKKFELTWEYGFIKSCTIKTPCPLEDIAKLFSHDAAQLNLTELTLVRGNDWDVFEAPSLEKLFTLPGMEKIRKLKLEKTPIVDLHPLRHLYQLEEINLKEVPVSDLTPLGRLNQLKVLDLSRPNYDLRREGPPDAPTDLSPLAKLQRLEKLSLEGRSIESLSPLQGCKKLKALTLKQVTADDFDLGDLRQMTQLGSEFLRSAA